MLDVRGLSVWYGDAQAIRSVDLQISQGEIVTLLGSNGAGKSTTLLAISGCLTKCDGTVTFLGNNILNQRPFRIAREGIAHVPEGRRIFPTLSVEENLRMGAYVARPRTKSNLERVYDLFPILSERRTQAGGALSGGEQQMLALGRALMSEPRLILLDEPSLGLAPKIVDLIYDVVQGLRKDGLTFFLVEQNVALALDVADRAYVLHLGEITWSGTAEEAGDNRQLLASYLGQAATGETNIVIDGGRAD